MARLTVDFYSDVLQKHTSMTVILPESSNNQYGKINELKNPEPMKTLYLLHGFTDDHTIWTRRTSIERYAESYGIAVVMPDVDHSFYSDMKFGKAYWTFLSEELVEKAERFFPFSQSRSDRYVAGLSMGGYGAIKWALRHPNQFAAVASLSGVLDLATREHGDEAIDEVMYQVYGDQSISDTEEDVFYLLKKCVSNNRTLPKIYLACGQEDFLFEGNLAFKRLLDDLSVPAMTTFDHGTHEWGYWDKHIEKVLAFLPL
ncbi:S-formylglutathione hydrolase FrmB [Streptohalobacillus salinus]|uniref:S-formylglutathione hydrolase FrmB n=1 Tax=Streptohalobacillus salinus TaxID=621096 RepID=A0A2V3WG43_9BACI|nr:alpha/beta hydrolase family protein [Streptohalobacillus salinus]PXW92699.1 S-formylglutathione hydrolase FrmB [Streptohalobacillus salinus]